MKRRIGSLGRPLNASNMWKSFEGSIVDIELPFDFQEFLKLLNENGVRYPMIRGYAVGYPVLHGRQWTWMSGLQSILIMRKGLPTR
jgi:hypothetical protein